MGNVFLVGKFPVCLRERERREEKGDFNFKTSSLLRPACFQASAICSPAPVFCEREKHTHEHGMHTQTTIIKTL